MRPRHEIDAWGTTTTSSGVGATTTARATSSLSEGENWIVVPPPSRGTGRSDDDDDPSLSGPRAFVSRDRCGGDDDYGVVFVLCVDVDDVGRVATVKDVRRSNSSSSCCRDVGVVDNDDDEEGADGSEFFLARRRRRRLRGPPRVPIPGDATPVAVASGLYDGFVTGDLDADDDESGFDDDEDVDGKMERRNDAADRRPPPPREDDVDDDGEFLYCRPEPLPRRQMRALRDGGERVRTRWRVVGGSSLPTKTTLWGGFFCIYYDKN